VIATADQIPEAAFKEAPEENAIISSLQLRSFQ